MSPGFISSIFCSGILFLALRGLSPKNLKTRKLFGIAGMAISIVVTFLSVGNFGSGFIYVIIFGNWRGNRCIHCIQNTYGCYARAGCWISQSCWFSCSFCCNICIPKTWCIWLGSVGNIKLASLIEMSLGALLCNHFFWFNNCIFEIRGIMSGHLLLLKVNISLILYLE